MSKVVKQERWITLVKTPRDAKNPCSGCIADSDYDSTQCQELTELFGINCANKQFRAFSTEEEAVAWLVAEKLE